MIKIDREGYTTAAFFIGLAILLYFIYILKGLLVLKILFCFMLVLVIFTLFFFRDPERISAGGEGKAISAADGLVVDVSKVAIKPGEVPEFLRVAVFMNVFNVHINRSPVSGKVISTVHFPGKKMSAFNKAAEYENEHADTDIETLSGIVKVRQIAGLIARRVVTRVKPGDNVEKGGRIGLIRFGSRVDVFFPLSYVPTVKKGDIVKAGETVIAEIPQDN